MNASTKFEVNLMKYYECIYQDWFQSDKNNECIYQVWSQSDEK